MYIVFGQKEKGQDQSFPLNEQISFLSDVFDNNCWIFCTPGYMSKGCNAKKYISRFNELVNVESDNKQYIGFGHGYLSGVSREQYIDEINNKTAAIGGSDFLIRNYRIDLPEDNRNNHSKMMFYFYWTDPEYAKDYIDKKPLPSDCKDEFWEKIVVKAMIVGSSNQSFNTFFREKADKGEADVVLIASNGYSKDCVNSKEDFITDIIINTDDRNVSPKAIANRHEEFFKTNIISKSIFDIENEEEYLKKAFQACLKAELK